MAGANVLSSVLPGKFDPNRDKWDNYREQLYFAFEAAGSLENVQKRALFLSQCGKEAFSLIVSLLSPKKPSEVSFETIIETLDRFFIPTAHPILETAKFYNRKQKPSESVTNFVAALHDISSRCKFADLPRRIAEQVILGTSDEQLKRELLKIKYSELSYEMIVQQALNYESLQRNRNESNSIAVTHREVAPTNIYGEPMDVNAIDSTTAKCVYCAKRHLNKCKFRNATCYKCHKKGHTRAACDQPASKQKSQVNKCGEQDGECSSGSEKSDSSEDNFGVHGLSGAASTKPCMIEVTVNGVPIVMEVDSGSARSILPHSVYLQNKGAFVGQIVPFGGKLVTWTGDLLKIIGETMVNVTYKGQNYELPLLISCGKGPALLGRTWFNAIGISIQGVSSLTDINNSEIIKRFPRLFSNEMDKYCGPTVRIECKEGVTPVFQRARSVPFPLREKVNEEIKKAIEVGIYTPVKHSRWATPLRIVLKPDGSLRLCGDYRSTVNATCLVDKYPLPTANEAFFQLSGKKYFSKVDLKHAYNQLKVDEETAELLTLNTPLGLMRMNRLAYGVNSATAIFQRLMSTLLAGMEGVACLLDDVVIGGLTIEEHDEKLVTVLQRLDEVGLKLNKNKCVFATNRVTFLGYEIDEAGIHPTKEKIEEISGKTSPTDKKTLKAFLGLYNFYERFLMEKSVVLQPLYRLLKENVKWQWGEIEQRAFNKAKALLTSDMTLVHYSLERKLLMLCDASEYGVGAVLVHKMDDGTERPVIMSSRTLQDHEKRYAQIDKEALAIMFGLKKFRQYLLGRKFQIGTDHKPLLGIFGREKPIPELLSARMQRWALILNTFDYTIHYRPGKEMGNADSLSRWPTPCAKEDCEAEDDVFLLEQTDLLGINSRKISKETEKDRILKKVKFYLLHGWPDKVEDELLPYHRRRDCLSLSKECILWANRVVIPLSLQKHVLKMLHDGHSGIVQAKMLARGYIWFPSLDTDIEQMISECDACQLNRNNPPITEHAWPAATKPWSRLHIDFMGPFMDKTFLVLVDAYSKWPVIEIVQSMTSKAVINILRKTFADNGLPEIVVSDNGLAFTGKEFQEFMEKNKIKHITGAPYHPATNGQAERTIQTIKSKLRKQSELPWAERVAKVLFHMRTAPSTVTGKTPAEMLNGRKFRTALTLLHPESDSTGNDVELEREEGGAKKIFRVGDQVLFRTFNVNRKWQRGEVIEQLAPALYRVRAADGVSHRRHVDQLLRTRLPIPIDKQRENMLNRQDDDVITATPHEEIDEDVVIPPPEEWPEIIGC